VGSTNNLFSVNVYQGLSISIFIKLWFLKMGHNLLNVLKSLETIKNLRLKIVALGI
jgi:hypothetical protein